MSVRGDRLAAYHVRRGQCILALITLLGLLWLAARLTGLPQR